MHLLIKPYSKTCSVKNKTNKDITIRELTPPMDRYVDLGDSLNITYPTHTLRPNQAVSLGAPGFYYASDSPEGLEATGCSIDTSVIDDGVDNPFLPNYFGLR
ncbi:MAG: hypothetical protein P3W93_002135 [Thermus sp.]|nr:hypothetical protein [Thermus sp.]